MNADELLRQAAEEQQKPDEISLKEITRLAEKQVELEDKVARCQQALDEAEKELNTLQMITLPQAMGQVGLRKLVLADGSQVAVDKFYSGSVPKDPEARKKALGWLAENGFGALVKSDIICSFGRDSESDARELRALLVAKGFSYTHKEDVHSSTLRAFIKERYEAGQPVPTDLFNVYVGDKTKITKGK